MDIRFVSGNTHKIREVREILEPIGIRVVPVTLKIEELQTEDVEKLVRDKVEKAFRAIGRPVFVEHTGLQLPALNDLPGGLTEIFWNRLEADRFAKLVAGLGNSIVKARTVIGYCDAKSVRFFAGEVAGRVPNAPAGSRDFQWDCVFVPEGETKTFAELGVRKNEISMRRRALDEFAKYLRNSQ